MKLLLVACFIGLAFGQPIEDLYTPIQRFYHETVGIKEAALIKAAEESTDFDGSRIVGGSAVNLGAHPFMAGLVITLTTGQSSVCGSSLISANRILTAAHCWNDGRNQARQFTVVLGSITLFSGGTRIVTSNVVMHPNWNTNNLNNDIAVGVINSVGFNNNIRSIPLASGSNLFVGVTATAVGFGAQSDGGGGIPTSQRLHHVNLQVITNAVCAQTFGSSSIVASTLCTSGTGGRSTCGGDSGGPLVSNNQLIGATSFGAAAGCTRGFPAAFARITAFHSWIVGRM